MLFWPRSEPGFQRPHSDPMYYYRKDAAGEMRQLTGSVSYNSNTRDCVPSKRNHKLVEDLFQLESSIFKSASKISLKYWQYCESISVVLCYLCKRMSQHIGSKKCDKPSEKAKALPIN